MMHKFKQFLGTTFLGGLVVLLPITVFFILANWIFDLISGIAYPFVLLFPATWSEPLIKLISFGVVIVFLFLIGLLVKTQFGSAIFNWMEENWLSKLPFYTTIKETTQQLFGKNKTPFANVVMIAPFGNGVKMMGFVTDEDKENDVYTIFCPTAPNPTNGFVFLAKKEDMTFLDISSEEAMKTIISLGAGASSISKRIKTEEAINKMNKS